MAQLIKLEDYISRYEWDAYRYPSQYIRLKREHWAKLQAQWLHDREAAATQPVLETADQSGEKAAKRFNWNPFRKKREEQPDEAEPEQERMFQNRLERFSETDLKYYFLDYLYPIQIKWATSTVTEVSFVNRSYDHNPKLKFLLQRFPDTFLVMYHPVFNIKRAPIDCDPILITPLGIEIIAFMSAPKSARIIAGDERKWAIEQGTSRKMILNPAISLKRTEHVIKSILAAHDVDFPVQKTILAKDNTILYATEPYQTQIIDEASYSAWFEKRRKLISPLKSTQLKAAEVLLAQTRTNAVKRPEWEEEKPYLSAGEADESSLNEQT